MSYIITIGNAELDAKWRISSPSDEDSPYARWVVREISLVEAPSFPFDPARNTNSRAPGYAQWANFLRSAGISALFIGSDGLMAQHPGIAPLYSHHLEHVRHALVLWMKRHPDSVPGWDWDNDTTGGHGADDGIRNRDGVLARLLWLEWWMDWALKNCERPAVHNT